MGLLGWIRCCAVIRPSASIPQVWLISAKSCTMCETCAGAGVWNATAGLGHCLAGFCTWANHVHYHAPAGMILVWRNDQPTCICMSSVGLACRMLNNMLDLLGCDLADWLVIFSHAVVAAGRSKLLGAFAVEATKKGCESRFMCGASCMRCSGLHR